jgi:sensor histidine kinase regulating citrate/malate metabolism
LDNSIESCIHIPQSYIELSVTYESKANLTVITLINSCRENPFHPNSKRLVSHKKEPLRHGFGIKSIERVVEKYNGNMNMYYDETKMDFHTIITLKSANTHSPLL